MVPALVGGRSAAYGSCDIVVSRDIGSMRRNSTLLLAVAVVLAIVAGTMCVSSVRTALAEAEQSESAVALAQDVGVVYESLAAKAVAKAAGKAAAKAAGKAAAAKSAKASAKSVTAKAAAHKEFVPHIDVMVDRHVKVSSPRHMHPSHHFDSDVTAKTTAPVFALNGGNLGASV